MRCATASVAISKQSPLDQVASTPEFTVALGNPDDGQYKF
jgi:hypothetical protein